jgi:Molybdopterin converting factor, small subunit
MKVKILLFGRLLSIIDRKNLELTVQGSECEVREIKKILFQKFPKIEKETFRIVVNQEICDESQTVKDGDEIAFLPPISGGAFSYLTRKKITHGFVKKISNIKNPSCGSVLIFEGKIRRDEETEMSERYIEEIEYSAYMKMAEREIEKIREFRKRKIQGRRCICET